ncbi:uncharacterized protein ARMOST_15158 [Armillaria ostoyae]|uniref:Uncharacterized protein n=1 Tax=Armillaria ostoyae TaxID=47428 RepID=A0A284RSN8_ARMOS|nr:uncharacterized protein ARMOST_15158 [Armillaria ostoyae]
MSLWHVVQQFTLIGSIVKVSPHFITIGVHFPQRAFHRKEDENFCHGADRDGYSEGMCKHCHKWRNKAIYDR